MKRTRFGKFLIASIISMGMMVVLPNVQYAATRMTDQLIMSTNNNITQVLGTEAGIYQRTTTISVKSTKSISSEMGNTRLYYGQNEKVCITFTFSRAIKEVKNPKLVIKFGEGQERVINECTKDNSYLNFEYSIRPEDDGGIEIVSLTGSVVDDDNHEIAIAPNESASQWKNQIIAKGSVKKQDNKAYTPKNDIITSESGPQGYYRSIEFYEKVHILDNNTITPLNDSNKGTYIKVFNTKTGNEVTNYDANNLRINGNTITYEDRDTDTEYVIYIPNACDKAGNYFYSTMPFAPSSVNSSNIYIYDGDKDGNARGNCVDQKYYYNDGKKVTFLTMALDPKNPGSIWIGMTPIEINDNNFEKELIADKIQKRTYIIKDGNNGTIDARYRKITDGVYGAFITEDFDNKYIADTTAPVISSVTLTSSSNIVTNSDNGYIYTQKNKSFFIQATITEDNQSSTTYTSNNDEFQISNSNSITAMDQGIASITITATDKAENSVSKAINEIANGNYFKDTTKLIDNKQLTLICDTTGPTVSYDSYMVTRNFIKIVFEAEDPRIVSSSGSGIYGSGVKGSIDQSKIKVTNGEIIGSTVSGSNVTLNVMPALDGYVSFYVQEGAITDKLDNESKASDITKVLVDRTAPVINNITGVPADWTDEATLSVIASDAGVGGIQYSFKKDNEEWSAYSEANTYQVTSNGTVYIKVIDRFGNESEAKTVNINKIDNETPTISGVTYHEGWTNQDVEVTINASDASSGIKEYSFDGGTSWQSSPKKTYTSTTTINANQIKVRDYAGKETTHTGDVINVQIDKDAPKITTVSINPEGKTEGSVTITVDAEDVGSSDLPQNCYSFNGGEYSSTNTYTVSKNGDVTIRVKDNAGNETSVVKTINNIKTFEPVITFENNGGIFVKPSTGNAKIKTVVKVEDASNVSMSYILSTSPEQPQSGWSDSQNSNRVELELSASTAGDYYLWAKVECNNQTRYARSNVFSIKESTITLTPSVTSWTNQTVDVNIEYGEGLTENRKVGVGSNQSANTDSVTLSENGIVYAEATDIAGNKVSAQLEVKNIDKTAPEISIDKLEYEYLLNWTDETVNMDNKISIVEDNLSTVEYTWTRTEDVPTSWDNTFTDEQKTARKANVSKDAKKDDEGVWYLHVKATDLAGNTTIEKSGDLVVNFAVKINEGEDSVIKAIKQKENKKYIIVNPKTTAEQLKQDITTNYTKTIENTADENILKTGSTLKIADIDADIDLEYTIVVKGDVNCDGKLDFSDIVKLNSIRLNKYTNISDMERFAADINGNDEIDFNDIVKLNSYRLGKTTTL